MRHLNRIALMLAALFATLLVLGVGAWWWRERVAPHEALAFDASRFAVVSAPQSPLAASQRLWLLVVNPGCPHCIQGVLHSKAAPHYGHGCEMQRESVICCGVLNK